MHTWVPAQVVRILVKIAVAIFCCLQTIYSLYHFVFCLILACLELYFVGLRKICKTVLGQLELSLAVENMPEHHLEDCLQPETVFKLTFVRLMLILDCIPTLKIHEKYSFKTG